MWEGFFRHALKHQPLHPDPLFALFWLIREVLWWHLAALLLGILAIFGVKSELFSALHLWRENAGESV
jgi:hypothetical protein